MKILNLLILIFLIGAFQMSFSQKSQTDYLKYRKKNKLISDERDSVETVQRIEKFLSIDSSVFTKNFHFYYNDLAMAYYIYYLYTKDNLYLHKAIENYHKVVDITKDYWNIAFCYIWLGDCENGLVYLQKYKVHTKKKYMIDEEQFNRLRNKCSE